MFTSILPFIVRGKWFLKSKFYAAKRKLGFCGVFLEKAYVVSCTYIQVVFFILFFKYTWFTFGANVFVANNANTRAIFTYQTAKASAGSRASCTQNQSIIY